MCHFIMDGGNVQRTQQDLTANGVMLTEKVSCVSAVLVLFCYLKAEIQVHCDDDGKFNLVTNNR